MSVRLYLDASAAWKLVGREDESQALARFLDEEAEGGASIVSSSLLETELRRVALRTGTSQALVTDVLAGIELVGLSGPVLRAAGTLPPAGLRSLDAVHVAAALDAGSDLFVTYDERQRAAAVEQGLVTFAPAG